MTTVLKVGDGMSAEPLSPYASSVLEGSKARRHAGGSFVDEAQSSEQQNGDRGGSATVPEVSDTEVIWSFRMSGKLVRWSWKRRGRPPLVLLDPVRKPWSSDRSRHRPATAFSTTNNDHVPVESGEEHDLLRVFDRDPMVKHVIPQPFRLTWKAHGGGAHTPDLLAVDRTGAVSVWDVRPIDQQDEDFWKSVSVARRACHAVGWQHQVFSGLDRVERLNLLWLNGFRRPPTWLAAHEAAIRETVGNRGVMLAELFAQDDGVGELKSAVWHLMWRGTLAVDLLRPITEHSRVAWEGDAEWPMLERS